MNSIKPSTINNFDNEVNKSLYYFDSGDLYISNKVSPDDLTFFKKYYDGYYDRIIYFEHDGVLCSDCDNMMVNNGSRPYKPNKHTNIREKQYICPVCGKTCVTSLEKFIDKNCNYTCVISEKSLDYESIGYLSYQKKSELINLENNIDFSRETAYYLASKNSENYIKQKEEEIQVLLKEANIQPSGIYHYDEEYLHENGEEIVRLTIIDAVNNNIINDQIIYKKNFDKDFMEIFLKYSLEGLPKKILITDGHPAYPEIIERICIKQQLCIFHIIKNHNTPLFKKINKIEKRIKTLDSEIDKNKAKIEKLEKENQGNKGRIPKNDTKRINNSNKRKKLKEENKKYRDERTIKREKLKKLEKTNERISNIYDTEIEKAAYRRFNTIYNQLNQFDKNTQQFLKNLSKKFDKTITYFKNDQIPKTNNKIEGYFKITLPKYLKRCFRTRKGLTRWIKLQKFRWIKRNVNKT